jgi:hypothetical protein
LTPVLVEPNAAHQLARTGIYAPGPDHERMIEQTEYLRGVLYADMAVTAEDMLALDPWGNTFGTAAFWRGVIEHTGRMRLYNSSKPELETPVVSMTGTYALLIEFILWLRVQATATSTGYLFDWDKLDASCSRGTVKVTGQRAQHIVRWLYTNAWVSTTSQQQSVNDILRWKG